jgi:hypothetical protein
MTITLHPDVVTFGDLTMTDVRTVRIDTAAERVVTAAGDGPHIMFADATGHRVEIIIERAEDPAHPAPLPGAMGVLTFETASGHSDALRRRHRAEAIFVGSRRTIAARPGGGEQLRFLALSSDGVADPIAVEDVL